MLHRVDLTEEEREFLYRVVDRASKLLWMIKEYPNAYQGYREPFNWISDHEKADVLLNKLRGPNDPPA